MGQASWVLRHVRQTASPASSHGTGPGWFPPMGVAISAEMCEESEKQTSRVSSGFKG